MIKQLLIALFQLLSLSGYAQTSEMNKDSTTTYVDASSVSESDSVEITDHVKNVFTDSLSLNNTRLDSAELANELVTKGLVITENEGQNNMPTDSMQLANKSEQLAKERLNKKGIELNVIPTDSAALKQEATSLAKKEFTAQTGIAATDITLDSTTTAQVKKEAKIRAENSLKEMDEFKELEANNTTIPDMYDMPEEMPFSRGELQKMEAKKAMKQKMTKHAKDFISEHADVIQEVQSQMEELKAVYSEVTDSEDLSTAKKRSSLKGESFWKRLVIGSNINLTKTNPVTIDFSPVVGWKFNKAFEMGITGAYRAKFGADQNGINSYESEDVYGYSVFAQHMAFKNFFGYLEGENMSKVTGTEEDHQRKWNPALMIGIGRKFKVAPFLEMQAIVTYNFLHDNTSGVYNSPVGFKTGFRVVK